MLLRPLLTIVALITALAVSGLSSAVAASFASDDDCCETDCRETDCCADRSCGDQSGDQSPEGHGKGGCSPVCHACACAPAFALPSKFLATITITSIVIGIRLQPTSQLPANPPGDDIFHPPRLST